MRFLLSANVWKETKYEIVEKSIVVTANNGAKRVTGAYDMQNLIEKEGKNMMLSWGEALKSCGAFSGMEKVLTTLSNF